MEVFIDIETIPTEDQAVIAEITATIKPSGAMKKAETIAAWEANDKPAAIAEAVAKTAFDGIYGKIICIGCADSDDDPVAFTGEEPDILTAFFKWARSAARLTYTSGESREGQSLIFIGHNLVGFDLRFLWKRSVINKIKMPGGLLKACRAKPWDGIVADTMTMWDADRDKRISLDKLCKALGVQSPKNGMDGSKVYEAYKAGEIERIAEYCCGDVVATREVYHRLMFQ